MVTILTGLNTVNVDVVNVNILVTNVVVNDVRQLIAVIDPFSWNAGLIRRVVSIFSRWRRNGIRQLGWTPGIFKITLSILDWLASNGIDNLSRSEVVGRRLRWCGGLSLLWTITVDVGDRLGCVTVGRVLNWNRLLTVNQVDRDVLRPSPKVIWQDIITEAVSLRGV